MLKFITKKEYWDVSESNILSKIKTKPAFAWHLKSIQDGIAFRYLHEYKDVCIAEIGGGDSRLLSTLAEQNTCFNIEEFKGVGNGPVGKIDFDGVNNVLASVGDFSESIETGKFEVIFSISVVEHIPDGKVSSFFKDCHRILKPSGIMIHLIDVYLEDAEGNNINVARRILNYGSFLDNKLFAPTENPEITTESDIKFLSSLISNPDNMMELWNRAVPTLRKKRERAQCCTLLMIGRKIGY